jgi:hypothetical protein
MNPTSDADDFFYGNADESGTALLANLPPRAGLYLSASRQREVLRAEPTSFAMEPGEVRELTWRIGSGCRVFGTVKAIDGNPVNGQEIWLHPRGQRVVGAMFFEPHDRAELKTVRCDEKDEFEFTDVSPGSWFVGPAAVRGQNDAWQDGLAASLAQNIEVLEGQSELRVDIALTRDLAIRGRVEYPDGTVPPGRILVSGVHIETNAMILANSEADGSFVLGPLAPGN